MLSRAISFVLLAIFGISLVVFPAMEAIHEMLHHIESQQLHSHSHSHHHTIADHHIHNTHAAPDADNLDANGLNYVSLLFVFFQQAEVNHDSDLLLPHGFSAVISFYQSLSPCPPFTPPLV